MGDEPLRVFLLDFNISYDGQNVKVENYKNLVISLKIAAGIPKRIAAAGYLQHFGCYSVLTNSL